MDKSVTGFRAAAMLAASVLVAGGCSRAQQPSTDSAEPAAADAPAALPAEISIPGTRVFPESITSTANGSLYIGSVGQAWRSRSHRSAFDWFLAIT